MTNYVVANEENMKVVKEMCKSHIVRLTEVKMEGRDEYILRIESGFFTWRKLKKVLPLDKPVLLHRIES